MSTILSSEMRRPLVVTMAAVAAISCSTIHSQAVGLPENRPISFSDVKVTEPPDPHAYGTKVELCKQAGTWVGFLSEYAGSVADPWVGRLENVRLDEDNGRIAFAAHLTVGVSAQKGTAEWVPVRNLYEFSGRINQNSVFGMLARRAVNGGTIASAGDEVTLVREVPGVSSDVSCNEWSQALSKRVNQQNPR